MQELAKLRIATRTLVTGADYH